MIERLSLIAANRAGLHWGQEQITTHHYLHHSVGVRCYPLAYLVQWGKQPPGSLLFRRSEVTRVTSWHGSVEDVAGDLQRELVNFKQ